MFDYLVTSTTSQSRARRWATAALSALGHVVVIMLLVIPALYATDVVPAPVEAIASFVVSVPTPPPPPAPPPPAEAAAKPAPKRPVRPAARPTEAPRPVAPVPIEAPSEIVPETGLEGIPTSATVEAGFEGGVEGGVPGGVVGAMDTAVPPSPPLPPRAPVRVGGAIRAPRLLQRVAPEYPELAERAEMEGSVILEATVGRDGRVDAVKVLRSMPVFEQAAIAAVQQWMYEPLMLNGRPEPFVLTVTVSFSLTR